LPILWQDELFAAQLWVVVRPGLPGFKVPAIIIGTRQRHKQIDSSLASSKKEAEG
jgi:hypothetical protein